jgi:hypothetical protein
MRTRLPVLVFALLPAVTHAQEIVGWVSGAVLDNEDNCIFGATVEIVAGQDIGRSMTRTTCPYGWDSEPHGFRFEGLTPGVPVTLRASASRYSAQEVTVRPFNRGFQSVRATRTCRR